jgi:hypothetical protein
MSIQQIALANTFQQWILATHRSSVKLNDITLGTHGVEYSNTNIFVGEDLNVNGNVNVTGTFILDEIGFNDLTIQGNLSANQSITASNAEVLNLEVTGNVSQLNVTSDILVPNGNVYGTLIVNTFEPINVTVSTVLNIDNTNVFVTNLISTDVTITNDLIVLGDAFLGTIQSLNISNANVTTLVGEARDQIYETINASTAAVTVAANVSAFLAFAIGLG